MDANLSGIPLRHPQPAVRVGPDAAGALPGCRRFHDGRLPARPVDVRDVTAGKRRVPDLTVGRRRDAVRSATAWRVERLNDAVTRVQPSVHPGLPGEPQHTVAVERGGVEVRIGVAGRQLEHLDLLGRGVHSHDRVQAAVRDPRGAVRPDDHAVRRGTRAEVDLADLPGRRVEVAERAVVLAGVPDATVGGGRDVVRMAARRDRVLHEVEGARG